MQILLLNSKDKWIDVTPMIPSVRWSGDYQQIARTLDFSIVSSPTDKSIPAVECGLGTKAQLIEGKETLFDGMIVSRTKSTEGNSIDCTCFDRGFQLKRNKVYKTYTSKKPEEITASLISEFKTEFDMEIGSVAKTGIPITRNFTTGNDSIDAIIATAYTLASRETKKQYHIGFRGKKLYVTVKEPDKRTLIIKGGSNLISASTTESIENIVSSVQIYDAKGNFVKSVENKNLVKLYGRFREIVKQTKDDNKFSEAQKLLDDNGVSQKITVDSLGNIANVTGGTVVVQEPYTGLYGLFYIDGDTHEWKRGQYYNKLVINYKCLMNEKEAGSLPNASGTKTKGAKTTTQSATEPAYKWDYYNAVGAK